MYQFLPKAHSLSPSARPHPPLDPHPLRLSMARAGTCPLGRPVPSVAEACPEHRRRGSLPPALAFDPRVANPIVLLKLDPHRSLPTIHPNLHCHLGPYIYEPRSPLSDEKGFHTITGDKNLRFPKAGHSTDDHLHPLTSSSPRPNISGPSRGLGARCGGHWLARPASIRDFRGV